MRLPSRGTDRELRGGWHGGTRARCKSDWPLPGAHQIIWVGLVGSRSSRRARIGRQLHLGGPERTQRHPTGRVAAPGKPAGAFAAGCMTPDKQAAFEREVASRFGLGYGDLLYEPG
jgi:hypothetical protein